MTLLRHTLAFFVRLLTGVRPLEPGHPAMSEGPRVVFANHASHFDTLVIWAALPPNHRARFRPVAAADYWAASSIRKWFAERVLRALLIERLRGRRGSDPVGAMRDALDAGECLLLFPEGTRSLDGTLGRFKSGLHHLASSRPSVPLIPAYLENLNRVLPKGELIPLPLLCSLRVGAIVELEPDESKDAFLARARRAVATLGGVAVEEETHA